MPRILQLLAAGVALACSLNVASAKRPNVILVMADDISAREFPIYESTKWYGKEQAKTPVLDKLSTDGGCFIETAWSCTICKPTRAMIMTGHYAHRNKYWDNKHIGSDSRHVYSAYKSSRINLGNLSRDAGYANIWVSKTHIGGGGDVMSMGFNEMVLTPAEPKRAAWTPYGTPAPNPYPIFRTDDPKDWDHKSFYWWPEVQLLNHPDYPNEPYRFAKTSLNDYAPDIEIEYIFAFMERSKKAGRPFFVYHTPHLGHTARDMAAKAPKGTSEWIGTPKIEHHPDGSAFGAYKRFDPEHILREVGRYQRINITPNAFHHHIEYLDYQMWQFLTKLEEMGELENTVIIFTADNATQGWGKASIDKQRGPHVPFMVYAPGIPGFRQGRQAIVSDLTDVLPTLADIMGFEIPADHELDGQSLWPYLTGTSPKHREWIYCMRLDAQLIRSDNLLRDGKGIWYDAREEPEDYDSFARLDDVTGGPEKQALLEEKARLEKVLPRFDLYAVDSEAPLPPKDSDGDGLSDAFEGQYGGSATAMQPQDDPDGDGTDNFHEFVFNTDPTDPAFPTNEQTPHLVKVRDAQGEYLALQFQRRSELGTDYWCDVHGSVDGKTWKSDGVIQQHTNRLIAPDTETVIARVAADASKSEIKELKLTVHEPEPRRPRKVETVFSNPKDKP